MRGAEGQWESRGQAPTMHGFREDSWSREQGLSSAGQRVRPPPRVLGSGVEGQR